jgi:large subunit ribosomal protein L33
MKEQAGERRGSRIAVSLACADCRTRNYKTTKLPDQVVELRKFCKQCKKHTVHRETK